MHFVIHKVILFVYPKSVLSHILIRNNSSITKAECSKFGDDYSGSNICAYSVRTGNCGTYCMMCLDKCFRKEKVY